MLEEFIISAIVPTTLINETISGELKGGGPSICTAINRHTNLRYTIPEQLVWDRFRGSLGPYNRDFHAGYMRAWFEVLMAPSLFYSFVFFLHTCGMSVPGGPDLKLINAKVWRTCEP